jgi:flagellar capping protein FliD
MVDALGGSVRVDSSGRTTVTGAGSDIDFGKTIDKIIEAKRQPAVRIENRIAENQVKVDALSDLQSRLNALEQAADALRGRPTFDNSGNVFEAKEGFLSATRADGTQPSVATSIMTANVTNAAQPGTQNLEVLQTAAGQQIAGTAVTDANAALNTAPGLGSFTGGDFLLNGRSITLNADDSLLDARDKINAANTGDNATGVNAQIVSVSDTEKILTLTAENAGESIALDDDPGGGGDDPLTQLGLVTGAGDDRVADELRAAQTSIFRVNGLSDGSVSESDAFALSETEPLSNSAAIASDTNAELEFEIDNGLTTQTRTLMSINTDTESLADIARRVSDEVFGVSARVVTTDSGEKKLEFNAANTGAVQRSQAQDIDPTTDAIDSLSDVESGTFDLRISNQGSDINAASAATISIDTTAASLEGIASDINAAGLNVTAITVTVDGQTRLQIASNDGGKVSVADVSGNLTQALGIEANDDIPSLTVGDAAGSNLATEMNVQSADAISRKSNTVDDLIQGVTLNLIKAERGTELEFDVERDQDAVNTAVADFVSAYNSIKQFINAQRLEVPLEGQDADGEDSVVGALQGERVLREVEQKLSSILSTGATNSSGDLSVLAQIGIEFVTNSEVADPTLEDTLTIDQDKLNDALLNDFDDMGKLFQFSLDSSSSNIQITGFTGETAAVGKVLEVTTDANGDVTGVAVGDTSGGTTAVAFDANGSRFTITEGPLSGLSLLYSGGTNANEQMQISTSTGIGSNAFFTSDNLGNRNFNDGLVQAEIDRITGRKTLDGENVRLQEEVQRIERSLTRERESLLRQFTAMEQALIELESMRERLSQFAASLSSGD